MSAYALFFGSSHVLLGSKIAQQLNVPLSPMVSKYFSDGNLYVHLTHIHPQQNVLIQSLGLTAVNNHFLELLFMLDALRRAGSNQNIVVLPYFSYAKADRLEHSGTSLRSQVCATCLQQMGAGKIITLDLHSPHVATYFKIPVINLSPVNFFYKKLRSQLAGKNLVVVSPDQGYHQRACEYGQLFSCPVYSGQKKRRDNNEHIAQITLKGDFENKTVLVVDDFTTSGNTLQYLSKILHRQGAREIMVVVTHCLLNQTALKKLLAAPIDKLITTNSLANPIFNGAPPQLECYNLANFLASTIRHTCQN